MYLTERLANVGFLLAMRLSVMCIAMVSQFALAHLLLAEGRGIYAVCVLFGTLSGVIFTPGADRGAQYFVMSGHLSLSKGLSVAYCVCVLGTAAAVAVMVPLTHSGLAIFETAPVETFLLAFLLVPAVTVSRTTLRQIAGLRRFYRLAAYSVAQASGTLATTVLLVWWLKLGVNGAIVALLAGHVLSTVLGVSYLIRHQGMSLCVPTSDELGLVLRYGLRDWVSVVGIAAESTIVALILGFIAGPAEIGLTALAISIVTRVLLISEAMAIHLAPRVAENRAGTEGLSASYIRIALWSAAAVLLAWTAVSSTVLDLLLPDEFAPVAGLTWILSAGVGVAAASKIMMTHFRASGRPEIVSWSVWAGVTSTLCLILVLYPVFGLEGAAWAVTGGYLTRGAVLSFKFSRMFGIPLLALLVPRHSDIADVKGSALHLLYTQRQQG